MFILNIQFNYQLSLYPFTAYCHNGGVGLGLWYLTPLSTIFQFRSAIERERIEIEQERLKTDKERLEIEKKRLKTDKERLEIEKKRLKTDKERLEIEKKRLKTDKERLEIEKERLKLYLKKQMEYINVYS
jgi:ABC-type phosphate transport system auxiliary subunit